MDKTDTKHVRFYYLRDVKGNPFGCVCTIRTDDNEFHRGISLCNFNRGDRFSKQIGRNISYARALKALDLNSKDRSQRIQDVILGLGEEFSNKMEYIYVNYWLTYEDNYSNHNCLNGVETNVKLTPVELSIWKDILNPDFLKK